jgi:prolipoprotein diacylglyceryltransferase
MYWIFHIFCVVYCLWRITTRYSKTSTDGVTGTSPGLETIMVLILAPVLAVVDIIVSWIMIAINHYKEK